MLIFITICCSPKTKVSTLSNVTYSPLSEYEPFAILDSDSQIPPENYVGEIEIKDSGFSIICDFVTVKSIAKNKAQELGANCMVITEHKLPSAWSTCHRIKAKVFHISNPRVYEKEIIWNENRKLEIIDFKGSGENRPFQAATTSSFRYRLSSKPFSKKFSLSAQTFFDCHASYFKKNLSDSTVLSHEQVHFDITEIFARKFINKMANEVSNINEANAKHVTILEDIWRELQIKQDEYDSDVYSDPLLQKRWNIWVQGQLAILKNFADKLVEFDPKKK